MVDLSWLPVSSDRDIIRSVQAMLASFGIGNSGFIAEKYSCTTPQNIRYVDMRNEI